MRPRSCRRAASLFANAGMCKRDCSGAAVGVLQACVRTQCASVNCVSITKAYMSLLYLTLLFLHDLLKGVAIKQWEQGGQAKIALRINSENEMVSCFKNV
jgi:peptidyl-tRNA hydrolase